MAYAYAAKTFCSIGHRIPGHFVPPPPPSRGIVDRNDSSPNFAIEVPSNPPLGATATVTSPSVALAFEDSGSKGSNDEVTIVVGRRKNSTTKAVRYCYLGGQGALTTFLKRDEILAL